MPDRYERTRRDGAWHVVDSADGSSVQVFPTGPGGAAAADAHATMLNRASAGTGRGRANSELRAWRRAHGLTQAQLAARLGVAWLTLQRWESGYAAAPAYLFLALKGLDSELP